MSASLPELQAAIQQLSSEEAQKLADWLQIYLNRLANLQGSGIEEQGVSRLVAQGEADIANEWMDAFN